MKTLNFKNDKIIVRNFEIRNISKQYINWFSGKNDNLKFSRHFKKQYNRIFLIKNLITLINSKNIFLGIYEKKNKELIGTITIIINQKNKTGDLGILIGNEKYLSKGYALESCKLVINNIFKNNIVNFVTAGTKVKNKKMIKLMKNLNMRKLPRQNSNYVRYIISRFNLKIL